MAVQPFAAHPATCAPLETILRPGIWKGIFTYVRFQRGGNFPGRRKWTQPGKSTQPGKEKGNGLRLVKKRISQPDDESSRAAGWVLKPSGAASRTQQVSFSRVEKALPGRSTHHRDNRPHRHNKLRSKDLNII
jgi:hypothetical protein